MSSTQHNTAHALIQLPLTCETLLAIAGSALQEQLSADYAALAQHQKLQHVTIVQYQFVFKHEKRLAAVTDHKSEGSSPTATSAPLIPG